MSKFYQIDYTEQMEYVRPFNTLGKGDAAIAGGKGASLGEMTQAGIPVPPGFVVLAEAFEKFLSDNDLHTEIDAALHGVDRKDTQTLEHASERIQALIMTASLSQEIIDDVEAAFKTLGAAKVAVRSSATAEDAADAAWAGQLDSYLNTEGKDLLKNIQRCWASLFTPRALFYRFEKSLHLTKISVAVVIQKMVDADAAGVAFSVHPVTQDRNQMIIEAVRGLGEALVSGAVTPDSYIVEKNPRRILDTSLSGSKQILNEQQITELSDVVIKIENHYGFPCDVEWASEGGKFYVVQSRPITTLLTQAPQKRIVLKKYYTREHSLFYVWVWREANCQQEADWFNENTKQVLFMRPSARNVMEAWYQPDDMAPDDYIAKIIVSDPSWLKRIYAAHTEHWTTLLPYFQGKEIENAAELKNFYNHWTAWWTPMYVIRALPEMTSIAEELRAPAMEIREETQGYGGAGNAVVKRYVEMHHPDVAEYAYVLKPEELFNSTIPNNQELEARIQGWFMTTSVFGLIDTLPAQLEKDGLVLEREIPAHSDYLKGGIGYPGIVKGIVRIVFTQKDAEQLQAGEILVSPMTLPELGPHMERAGAVVTDEGGITSHAAIIAREMKKPCVIGTKVATQILKNGDLVEVDAEQGVVRVIERA